MRTALLLLMFCLAAPLAAQPTFGLKAGLSLATVRVEGETLENTAERSQSRDARLGLMVGAWGRLALTPQLGVQAEALLVQKSSRFTDDISGFRTQTNDTDLAYLEVPILVRYYAPALSPGLDVGVYGGPALGILLSDTETVTVDDGEPSEITEQYTATDLGVAVGVGVARGALGVDLRYTLGIADVLDPQAAFGGAIDVVGRNGALTFAATYRLR